MSIPLLLSTRSHAEASRLRRPRGHAVAGSRDDYAYACACAAIAMTNYAGVRLARPVRRSRIAILCAGPTADEAAPARNRRLAFAAVRRTPTRSIEMRCMRVCRSRPSAANRGKPKVTYCEVSVFEPSSNVLSFANKKPHVLGLSVVAECRSIFQDTAGGDVFQCKAGQSAKKRAATERVPQAHSRRGATAAT